ncbi:transmembrane protein 210 isoform X2 [Sarcophilus harrisii]|uniref:transmembrane protein 210 isoform X2 n=1 Tax=Sarcophilus harrisii TaxID=9305 RepID=UPI00062BDE31|nr:transmembrane protein 210 isoform X2 [Sarcophilus harrisii]
MFPQPQPPLGRVGNISCLLLLAVSISSAADTLSIDGKHCECGLGISREALTTLLIVLGGVSVSCFSALLLVVVSIIRTKRTSSQCLVMGSYSRMCPLSHCMLQGSHRHVTPVEMDPKNKGHCVAADPLNVPSKNCFIESCEMVELVEVSKAMEEVLEFPVLKKQPTLSLEEPPLEGN